MTLEFASVLRFLEETDSSDFMAMYTYRLKVEESAENRAADDIL
jgi:hypothetical protein